MRGRLVDLSMGMNRKQRITIEVDRDFRADFDRLKDAELDVEVKKHRNRRSLSANAYFHVLVNKIAAERGTATRPPRPPWSWNTEPWPRMPTG